MLRLAALVLVIAMGAPANEVPSAAWPHRALVSALDGAGTAFSAASLGGELAYRAGGTDALPQLAVLARGDTLRGTTMADYPLDLRNGPIVFFTTGRDSIEVTVGRNPFGAFERVTARGRHLTLRWVADRVVVEAQ